MINATITEQNVDFMVNGFKGDFIGFQAYMEGLAVGLILPAPGFLSHPDLSV